MFCQDYLGSLAAVLSVCQPHTTELINRPEFGLSELGGTLEALHDGIKAMRDANILHPELTRWWQELADKYDLHGFAKMLNVHQYKDLARTSQDVKTACRQLVEWSQALVSGDGFDKIATLLRAGGVLYVGLNQTLTLSALASDPAAWRDKIPGAHRKLPEYIAWANAEGRDGKALVGFLSAVLYQRYDRDRIQRGEQRKVSTAATAENRPGLIFTPRVADGLNLMAFQAQLHEASKVAQGLASQQCIEAAQKRTLEEFLTALAHIRVVGAKGTAEEVQELNAMLPEAFKTRTLAQQALSLPLKTGTPQKAHMLAQNEASLALMKTPEFTSGSAPADAVGKDKVAKNLSSEFDVQLIMQEHGHQVQLAVEASRSGFMKKVQAAFTACTDHYNESVDKLEKLLTKPKAVRRCLAELDAMWQPLNEVYNVRMQEHQAALEADSPPKDEAKKSKKKRLDP